MSQTDFQKMFMVKINKMIGKKTGGIFLVVSVIYGSLKYTDNQENCVLSTPSTTGFIPYMQPLKDN